MNQNKQETFLLPAMRLGTLVLSFSTLIGFAYALAGLGGYLVGEGKPLLILKGSAFGIVSAVAALQIWKRYLATILPEPDKPNRSDSF